ncbi:MAG: hypothetical protein ACPGJV_11365 [Bacteriovoracaceae bacterium]
MKIKSVLIVLLFALTSCSTDITIVPIYCDTDGKWINIPENYTIDSKKTDNEVKDRYILQNQYDLAIEKDLLVWGGVGTKKMSFEEVFEYEKIKCNDIQTFQVTTYSTWFESALSIIPLLRVRSLRIRASYQRKEDKELYEKIDQERSTTPTPSEEAIDNVQAEEETDADIEAILDGSDEDTEYSEDDFEE